VESTTEVAVQDRNKRAWELRVEGMNFEQIGRSIPRCDGGSGGVTKARAWQIVREEFDRRAAEARFPETVEALYLAARSKSLRPALQSALGRFGGDGSNGGNGGPQGG